MIHRAGSNRDQVQKRRVLGPALLALCASLSPALANDSELETPPPIERTDLDRLCETVALLPAEDLPAFFEGVNSSEALRALIVRAGTRPKPGLSAARTERREAGRLEATDFLIEYGSDPIHAERILSELRAILEDPVASDVLWAAAATVVGDLALYELAPALLVGLDANRSSLVRAEAVRALHALTFRWAEFDAQLDPQALRSEWGLDSAGCSDFYREQLDQLDRESRALTLRLLELEAPGDVDGRGARALLTHDDPEIRAASARVLMEAIASGRVDASDAIGALANHLTVELDPAAWHATVVALLEPLASAPLDSPQLSELRLVLEESIGTRPDLRSSLAWALSRLPWDMKNIAAEGSVLVGVDRLSRLFEETALRSDIRDEDELLAVLSALEGLLTSASDAGVDLRSRPHRASETLLRLAVDPGVSNDIRSGAAACLALVAPTEDVSLLVTVLESEGLSTSLAYTLLGALGRMAEFTRPETESGKVVLDALVTHTAHEDVDLRSRALSLLLEPELEALTRLTRPAIWIERLEAEDQPALQSSLLKLLGRHGRVSNLEPLLASAAIDRILTSENRQVAELTDVLRIWTRANPELAMQAARRLHQADSPLRIQQALALIADLNREQARTLPLADHCDIHAWTFTLVEHETLLFELESKEGRFVKRVLDLHLPKCLDGSAGSDVNFAHQRAVLTGALLRYDPESSTVEAVELLFAEALSFNEQNGTSRAAVQILLDRAHFEAALDQNQEALESFRNAWTIAVGAASEDVWAPHDFRTMATLAAKSTAPAPDRALEVALIGESLTHSASWTEEAAELRIADLERWTRAALDSHDAVRIAAAHEFLTGESVRDLAAEYGATLESLRERLTTLSTD